ncbi:hypothetical protein NE237_014631 [Protea cynaroides]|uniref:Uncharacterized protein n=1 Tax=Protea cynaroides TaxID=273540 RepID=A0A9Q0QQ63_9MAGN|nr:hypothetical protein NE237_014631 [Protea cynaroides]
MLSTALESLRGVQESERLMGAIRTERDAAITAKAEMESQLEAANGKLLEAEERFLKAEELAHELELKRRGRNHLARNGLDSYGTTWGRSYSPESEWVRANHKEGGDVDLFSQSGWTELLKGLPLNEGDILTFQYEGDVILTVTTPHSMTGYEKVGFDGLLAV